MRHQSGEVTARHSFQITLARRAKWRKKKIAAPNDWRKDTRNKQFADLLNIQPPVNRGRLLLKIRQVITSTNMDSHLADTVPNRLNLA